MQDESREAVRRDDEGVEFGYLASAGRSPRLRAVLRQLSAEYFYPSQEN
jgi:hypothetical protein